MCAAGKYGINNFMKQNNPLPMLEANCFLKNRINGFTTEEFCRTIKKRFPQNEAEYKAQFDILLRLDAQLARSIAVTREEAELLYCPLSIKHEDDAVVAQDGLADILIPDIAAFDCGDCDAFFARLRAEKSSIPQRIAEAICPEERPPAAHETAELLALINGCDWCESSKLILIELAFNPEKYISMLEKALRPVAAEFEACRETWQPLVAEMNAETGAADWGAAQLHERFGDVVPKAANYVTVPTVTGFRQVFFSEQCDEKCLVAVGVLYETLIRISTMESNSEAELSRIMSVLGDPSRFNIVLRLSKQQLYGREIAKLLNITPGAVSQHLSILMSTGLIDSNNIGKRVYYSLNENKMQHFIRLLQSTFPPADREQTAPEVSAD